MEYAPLSRDLLMLTGPDTRSFLQGLLTVDVNRLSPNAALYGLMLSPQGKFLHEMFIIDNGEHVVLDTGAGRAEELRKRLMLYRLRAKVEIALEKGISVYSAQVQECGDLCIADPRLETLGWRVYSNRSLLANHEEIKYHVHRLELGVPDEHDLLIDKSLPMEWGMDTLHAIDFDKGCYIGQEVTARMRYRAVFRHYVHQVRSDAPLPPMGTPVMQAGKEIGQLHSSHGRIGLARLSLEAVAKADELPITAHDVPLTATLPKWVTRDFTSPS